MIEKLEELPQCRPPQKIPRGMDRLMERYFERRDPGTSASKASAAVAPTATSGTTSGAAVTATSTTTSSSEPTGAQALPWDKGWSYDISELRARAKEPKSARALKRKEAAAKVLKALKDKKDDDEMEPDADADGDAESGEEKGEGEDEDDELTLDDDDEEEEPGDYTNSYFDNGEEDDLIDDAGDHDDD